MPLSRLTDVDHALRAFGQGVVGTSTSPHPDARESPCAISEPVRKGLVMTQAADTVDTVDTEERGGVPDLAALPPHVRMLFLLMLPRGVEAVVLAADLGIADQLAESPRTPSELAESTGCQPDFLRRVLLTAAALGVFAERADGRFVLTEDAECLRSDAEISLRDLAIYTGNLTSLNSFDELRHTVRTGVDAFRRKFGTPLYERLAEHPDLSGPFNRAMNQTTKLSAESVANFGDFGRFTTVADIGGGQGQLIGELLRRHPDLRGIVFDFPHVTEGAEDVLTSLGVADRVTVMSGDFLKDALPDDADAYLFHRVLGGWEDERIVDTLRHMNSKLSDRPNARVILAEQIVPPPNTFHPGRLFDIEFMVNRGGRVRTEDDWRTIITGAGLEFVSARPAKPVVTLFEAKPSSP